MIKFSVTQVPVSILRAIFAISIALGASACSSATTYPCQSLVKSGKYAPKTGFKAMVAGGNRCYWSWSKPSLQVASSSALNSCRKQHGDCRVVAINDNYVGQPVSQTGSVSGSDLAAIAGVAAAAGGIALGVDAIRNGRSVPSPAYTPIPAASRSSGPCPDGWYVDPLYPNACTCGKTMTLGRAHAHQHARQNGPCMLPR